MNDLISYVVQNPGMAAGWLLTLTLALMGAVEVLMFFAKFTKTKFDDNSLGKIHGVLLKLRKVLIPYTEK